MQQQHPQQSIMDRFFGDAATPYAAAPALPGSSSLSGQYICGYAKCSGPYAQLGRFQCFSLSQDGTERIVSRAMVCTPECAAAHNRYVLSAGDPESDAARARHLMLEKIYGRRIIPAPAPNRTQDTNRLEWLRVCRAQLSAQEWEVAERELQVQRLVPQSVAHIK